MGNSFESNGLKVEVAVVGMYSVNCYILSNVNTKKAVIVDPGDQGEMIVNYVKREGFEIEGILLTHGHFDHITGVAEIRNALRVPVYAFEEEKGLLEDASVNASAMIGRPVTVMDVTYLKDKQVLNIAGFDVTVLSTPGHTKGSCCYYFEKNECLFSGDTLFMESVGRTDLPTGNSQKIIESLHVLLELPEDTYVFSGHGNPTTIKNEKANNPFVNGWG